MKEIYNQDENFLYGINLDDRFSLPLLGNLLNFGQAWTPDRVARVDSGIRAQYHSLRNVDIQELRLRAFEYSSIPTPGAGKAIFLSSMIRSGMNLYEGAIHPKPFSEDDIKYFLKKSDVELDFEDARRRIVPNAVSRLNSLYVTKDIEIIRACFGPYAPILKVRISKRSMITKADIRWFDSYNDAYELDNIPRCVECIESYWKCIPYDRITSRWEYLVDGMIEVVDGLDDLRAAIDERELIL